MVIVVPGIAEEVIRIVDAEILVAVTLTKRVFREHVHLLVDAPKRAFICVSIL